MSDSRISESQLSSTSIQHTKSVPNFKEYRLFEGSLTGTKTDFSSQCPNTTSKYSRYHSFPLSADTVKHRENATLRDAASAEFQCNTGVRAEEIKLLEGNKTFERQREKIGKLLRNNPQWNEKSGLDKDCDPAELKFFYIMANQLLIFAEQIPQCLLCTCSKSSIQRSHIFPQSLLDAYSDIHCTGFEEKGKLTIWDESMKGSNRRIAPSELSFPLFCKTCEDKASRQEGFLRDKYLEIMGSGVELNIVITRKDYDKLKRILALLLFRGALLNINIVEELLIPGYLDFFWETFIQLRNFCLEEDHDKCKDSPITNKLQLFLLPNTHFNPDNIEPTFLLDYQLRNPQYTSIALSEGTPFLYMKFDCFHCVLPFHGDVKDLTDSVTGEDSSTDVTIVPKNAINDFPKPLLHYNLFKVESLLYRITEYQYPKDTMASLQTFKMLWTNRKLKGYRYPVAQNIKCDPLILKKRAQDFSPLRDAKDALEELHKAEKEKSRDLSRLLCTKEEAYQVLTGVNKSLSEDINMLQNKLETLGQECKDLQLTILLRGGNDPTMNPTPVLPISQALTTSSEHTVNKIALGQVNLKPEQEAQATPKEQGMQAKPKQAMQATPSELGMPKPEQGTQSTPKEQATASKQEEAQFVYN